MKNQQRIHSESSYNLHVMSFVYSIDSRGEVEGSSDNNSPPTSVIQGKSNNPQTDLWDQQRKNPAYDWLRGAFNGKVDEETLLTQLRQHR